MKNIYIILLTALIISCNKETDERLDSRRDVNLEFKALDDIARNNNLLNTAAIGIIERSRDPIFREYVHAKVREQFDGDDNVLLKTIDSKYPLMEKFKESIRAYGTLKLNQRSGDFNFDVYDVEELINLAIHGFEVFEGEQKWYPQIYVPFIDQVDLESIPTIVVGNQDGGDCRVLGYRPHNNKIGYKAIMVDERYASENLVWVISTNESVDNDGNLVRPLSNENSRSRDLIVFIEYTKISSTKECWLCGAADVSMSSLQLIDDSNCEIEADNGNTFLNYVKIGKKSTGNWIKSTSSGFNPFFIDHNKRLEDNQSVIWVVFEKDNTTKRQKATFPTFCSGVTHEIKYQSKDSYFGKWGAARCNFFDGCNAAFGHQEVAYDSKNSTKVTSGEN